MILSFLYYIEPEHVRVARELHKDGEPHLHVAFSFNKPLHVRNLHTHNIKFFGKTVRVDLPRSYTDVLKYISKDDDYHDEG